MNAERITYSLRSRRRGGIRWLCWMTDEGVPLSPEFRSLACAQSYAKKMPMITDEEWNASEAHFTVDGKLHEWNHLTPAASPPRDLFL